MRIVHNDICYSIYKAVYKIPLLISYVLSKLTSQLKSITSITIPYVIPGGLGVNLVCHGTLLMKGGKFLFW